MTKQTRLPKKVPGSRVKFTMQSVRLALADNRKMKAEAKRSGVSFNLWAVQILTDALRKAERLRERKRISDGPTAERMRQASRQESNSDAR